MGSLVKMRIESFTDRQFSKGKKEYVIPINPESFSKNLKVEYDTTVPHGNTGPDGKYNATALHHKNSS